MILRKFQAKLCFTRSSTHDLTICNLQAHLPVTVLQTCVRKQSLPYQAYLDPSIHQHTCNHFSPSAHYPHLEVPLPLIAMWCPDDSHSMQLYYRRVQKDFQRVVLYLVGY